VRIVWERSVYGGKAPVPCVLCGQRFHPLPTRGRLYVLAIVYNDQGRMVGEACRDCLCSGSAAIRAHLQERLRVIEQQQRELKALLQEDILLPTVEEEFNSHA
jgi:hypothetical protein